MDHDFVDLFFDLLRGLPDRRAIHSRAVGRKAIQFSGLVPPSIRADLATAAILHDIGYAHHATGFHAIDGARFLGSLRFSRLVCHLVAHHTASSLEAVERGVDVALFDEFRVEEVAGLDRRSIGLAHGVLWWADLTTGPDGEDIDVRDRLDDICSRYGPDDPVTRFVDKARETLIAAGQLPIGSIQVPVSSIAH